MNMPVGQTDSLLAAEEARADGADCRAGPTWSVAPALIVKEEDVTLGLNPSLPPVNVCRGKSS